MCGRYTIRSIFPAANLTGTAPVDDFLPRFNVAPTQDAPIVRLVNGAHGMDVLRWGLIPSWASDPSMGNRFINARSEGVATSKVFAKAYEKRRCLVAADGFYEWRGDKPPRQPFFIRFKEDRPFAFGGLWEYWKDRDSDTEVRSFTILTTGPNDVVRPIHDRMPVIISPEHFGQWLDPTVPGESVTSLLRPYPAQDMEAYPVGLRVNSPKNDDASLIEMGVRSD
jgi:putative SOS response-associated peptidase YedK